MNTGAYEWPISETLESRFWQKVTVRDGDACWLWQAFVNRAGYGMIRNGEMMALAHRVSWVIAHGAVPRGLHVLHHCDTPACVNPSHLYCGTNADNIADKVRRGRSSFARPDRRGELHPLAKLTEADVATIRSRAGVHGEGRRLAREFGVAPSTICHIQKRQIWRHAA